VTRYCAKKQRSGAAEVDVRYTLSDGGTKVSPLAANPCNVNPCLWTILGRHVKRGTLLRMVRIAHVIGEPVCRHRAQVGEATLYSSHTRAVSP